MKQSTVGTMCYKLDQTLHTTEKDVLPNLSINLLLCDPIRTNARPRVYNHHGNKSRTTAKICPELCLTVQACICLCVCVMVFSAHVEFLRNFTGSGNPEEHKHPLAPPTLPSHLGDGVSGGGVCVGVCKGGVLGLEKLEKKE